MDLGRWSFKNLGSLLGDVLDSDVTTTAREPFVLDHSFENLDRSLALVRPGASDERVLQAFLPFFDGGMLLRDSQLTSFFLFGDLFTPAEPLAVSFGLEGLGEARVVRLNAEPVLSALNIGVTLEGAMAFAFRVSDESIFVLFDRRPHPWQVGAIENAYLAAIDTYSRIRR